MRFPRLAVVFLIFVLVASARAQTTQRAEEPESPRQASRPVSPVRSNASGLTLDTQSPFLGGVPSGERTNEVLPLSLRDAIHRGLQHNLGVLLSGQDARAARGTRLRALSDLLPNVTTHTSETVQQVNLAQFGFSGFPGVAPVIGPFSVFDTRAYLSQPLLDLPAIHRARAESANLEAARYSYQDARDLVVLVTAGLYLQALAGSSRADAQQVQVRTAEALYNQAVDLKKAGLAPGIDVLRAQVELQSQQQRLIFFKNEFAKQKLLLARAIGLPIGQEFSLADRIPYAPAPPLTVEEASQKAYASRADYQSALAQLRAAEADRKAARSKFFPALRFDGNYGDVGFTPGRSHGSFLAAFDLEIPIFQGGRIRGEALEADAHLQQRRDELADLRSRIDLEVRTALLDQRAAGEQVQVARSALDLANQQLQQAQDRFAAGVVNNIEVVQAQEAVATANENVISSLFAFNLAKAALARAMGVAEKSVNEFFGGKP